jgi:alpha-D-ribose 1-methylphosphonate 5-triphosphate synthase subunit PhnI
MGYTAMRGGLDAIQRAEALLRELEASAAPDLGADQLRDHLRGAVHRAMSEGGLYDPNLAALAVRQSEGDGHEAALLLRAFRTTLPRIAYGEPFAGDEMELVRRITPAFKSSPGGQILGRTRDYSQRLLDFDLAVPREPSSDDGAEAGPHADNSEAGAFEPVPESLPHVTQWLRDTGLAPELPADDGVEPYDVTVDPLRFPAPHSARLQALARGETGAMTALAYSTMRGHGAVHSTIAELRVGYVPLRIRHPYTGEPVRIGEVEVTEVEDMTLSRHTSVRAEEASQFGFGYGLVFGENERKAIAMALLDRAMDSGANFPAADEEFVLFSIDGVEASGFVEHLKLPHYVEFQAITQRLRALQQRLAAQPRREDAEALAEAELSIAQEALTSEPADSHEAMHALGLEHEHAR